MDFHWIKDYFIDDFFHFFYNDPSNIINFSWIIALQFYLLWFISYYLYPELSYKLLPLLLILLLLLLHNDNYWSEDKSIDQGQLQKNYNSKLFLITYSLHFITLFLYRWLRTQSRKIF